ncbi:hypothetical protein VPAL9027_01874 [Vibrio palustris]|uniref:Uncharacterized protein n=1 Tax=Vibrio palustris TaxID=1918946 RepID=A0A1R4B4R0_9VIBR|nr:hypothetical protein VPAL9027_01874 [Vibrio palustris]
MCPLNENVYRNHKHPLCIPYLYIVLFSIKLQHYSENQHDAMFDSQTLIEYVTVY